MKQTPQSRKINEAARTALADILLLQVSDPRLAYVTVTGVEVSKDRSMANIYVSAEKSQYADVEAGLASAKGRIRSLLGQSLGWRVTPDLRFFLDTSIDEAEVIAQALTDVPKTMGVLKDEEGYPYESR
ncbi:MAG TPA: 30S ribosome-binding factor RbfA [Coriobacteriia bacterium]|nr:30S ribosome-binding factor RbfA [Coriobacteriia bacterium]